MSISLPMRYLSQLEPDALIEDFIHYPPLDFSAWLMPDSTPVFSAEFDLLTTLEPQLYRRITQFPLYKIWGRWLRPYTCFVGATVSEYALFPPQSLAEKWVETIKQALVHRYAFVIIKDIPQQSPLLNDRDNQFAAEVMQAAQQRGFVLVEGQALAWVRIDFGSVDEYLGRLSKSSRKDFRRKLKARDNLAIAYVPTGAAQFFDEALLDTYYALYVNVYEQSDIHFDILSRAFFKSVLQNAQSGGVVMEYRCGEQLIGFNICFVVNGKLIDKYVGFLYPQAREHNIYFVSWFVNLEYAIEHQLSHYIAGWTDPQVKKSLGAQFTFTCHAVHVRNPLVRNLLLPFKKFFERDTSVVSATQADPTEKLEGQT